LYPVIRDIYDSRKTLETHVSVPIYDAPNYFPEDFTVIDINPDMSKFAGTATWKAGAEELENVWYSLHFYSANSVYKDPIALVKGGQSVYSVDIPEMEVPEDVVGIGLVVGNDRFTSPFLWTSLLEDKRTPAIDPSSITVNSKSGQPYEMIVKGLSPWDVIRMYSEDLTVLYGVFMVGPDPDSFTMSLEFVPVTQVTKVVITRQTINRGESLGTVVTLSPAQGGTPGGGPIGGGPMGGGPIGGGPIASNDHRLETKTVENADGTISSLTEVTSAYISNIITGPDFQKNPEIHIKADENASVRSSQFEIDANAIASIIRESQYAVLILESRFGKIQLPVQSLSSAVTRGAVSDRKLVVTIAPAAREYKSKLGLQFAGTSSVLIGDPVEFEVAWTGSGGQRFVANFSDYVGHVMSFPAERESEAVYAGFTFDPMTQTFVPVPTKWEWKDGILHVTLLRKGNSVYTVVKNHVQFTDLENSNPYSDSILALANRGVIAGYPDGSFRAERVVTRAEFASMLNRALGILPKPEASRDFKDVKKEDWFAAQVNAAVDAGLINGYTDGTFRPNQEITHQEMVAMLVNALKYGGMNAGQDAAPLTEYPAQLPEWAKPYFTAAMNHGLLPAEGPFLFRTNKFTERQESALLIHQLLKVLKLTNME
jgi:hypothetical protein